ncbi:MAG: hypothetical protein LBT00_15160 [Spirochaetaceae bacterium]|nr:hypothetical protein [Spirochaetaceae bacterium]
MDKIISAFPPIALALLLVAVLVAVAVFITGFARHGVDFVKHGFKQNLLNELMAKLATKEDINTLNAKLDSEIGDLRSEMRNEIGNLRTDLVSIKVNHFGHLKNFLTELTSILLDQEIINHENKTRLDNQLRGM